MNNFVFALFTCFLLASCYTPRSGVSWEKSNASLINKSIKNLNALDAVKQQLDKTEKLIIVGSEDVSTGDYSLLSNIEDELIKEFVSEGYNILERDLDLLYRMFSEEDENYSHLIRIKKAEYATSNSNSSSGVFGSKNSTNLNNGYNSSAYIQGSSSSYQNSNSGKITNYDQVFKTGLSSADKILSYRVIESGVVYDMDEKKLKPGEVEREARTILEAKLIDAKTSKVLKVFTLDGNANDFIPVAEAENYKHFSYKYYSHTLPKTHGNPPFNTVKEKAKGKPLPWILGSIGFIVFIALIAG